MKLEKFSMTALPFDVRRWLCLAVSRPYRFGLRPWCALLLIAMCSFVHSQTTADNLILQPTRKDLVAVHFPDLSTLEEGVRAQLTKLQASVASVVKNPKTSPGDLSEAYASLAQVYHAYSLTAPARDAYVNANRLSPTDFRWIYLLAKLDQQQGRFADAITSFRVALTLRPDYVAIPVNLGNIFLELNR